jgi:hypothetical protein
VSGSALQRILDGAPLKPGDVAQAIKALHLRTQALEEAAAVPPAAPAVARKQVAPPAAPAEPVEPVEPPKTPAKAATKRAPRKASP